MLTADRRSMCQPKVVHQSVDNPLPAVGQSGSVTGRLSAMDDDVIFTRRSQARGLHRRRDRPHGGPRRAHAGSAEAPTHRAPVGHAPVSIHTICGRPHLRLIAGTMPQLHPRAAAQPRLGCRDPRPPAVSRDGADTSTSRGIARAVASSARPLRSTDRCYATSTGSWSTDLPSPRCRGRSSILRGPCRTTRPSRSPTAGWALGVDPAMLAEDLEQARSLARRRAGSASYRLRGRSQRECGGVVQPRSDGTTRAACSGPAVRGLRRERLSDRPMRLRLARSGRRVGEFDGRMKYGRFRRPGETAEDAVHREKLREDALRDQGWQVARWIWDDLSSPQVDRGSASGEPSLGPVTDAVPVPTDLLGFGGSARSIDRADQTKPEQIVGARRRSAPAGDPETDAAPVPDGTRAESLSGAARSRDPFGLVVDLAGRPA